MINGKVFNKLTRTGGARGAYLSIYSSGSIIFNKSAISLMGMSAGCGIMFVQDEQNLDDWYVIVPIADHQDAIRTRSCKNGHLAVNCAAMVRAFESYFCYKGHVKLPLSMSFKTAEDGTRYYLLITLPAKNLSKQQLKDKYSGSYEFAKQPEK
ncbi:MAG TPA: hypothetical protein PKD70_11155 [Saprospiraceae bacterium]|nr:hypothetical protein [Saprospiraceae bacterium]HMP14429.1 hypothetical protein [Saprospiraceae bacterium]